MVARARPQTGQFLCPTLIGRDAELATLEAAFADTLGGNGRAVVLSGDAGIGKSRLLSAFLSRARVAGARVLFGRCLEAEIRRPFGPFIDALRTVPDLSPPPEAHHEVLADADLRYRSMRFFATAFTDLARKAPIVIAIDDLQWADEGTLDLFAYSIKALRDRGALIVGTYRSDDLPSDHPMRAVIAELVRSRLVETLTLRGLSSEESVELIRATLAVPLALPGELSATIQSRCEGNPFFIEETLRALAETGRLSRSGDAWHYEGRADDILPASVRDMLRDRLVRLTAEGRAALRVAAVIGPSFGFDLLHRITRMPEEPLTEALREAVSAQLIEESGVASGGEFRFRHALTRETVLVDLLGPERRRLHGEIALAVEATAGEDPDSHAEELAYHYDEAGIAEKAFRYHIAAGKRAEGLRAFAQAKRHFRRALELVPGMPDEPDLQLRLSKAALACGEGQTALRAARDGHRLYRERSDTRGTGAALSQLAAVQMWIGQAHEAWRLSEEAIRTLEPLGDSTELAEAYWRRVQRAPHEFVWLDRMLAVGKRLQLPGFEAIALRFRGVRLAREGRIEALQVLRDALERALVADDPDVVFGCRVALLSGMTFLARPPVERWPAFHELVAHARAHGFTGNMLVALEVEQAIAAGDFDAALRRAGTASPEGAAGAEIDLRIALVEVARHGPTGMPDLDALRARLRSGPPILEAFSATSAQVELLVENARSAVEHVESASQPILDGAWQWNFDIAAILGVESARRLGDDGALERWTAVALHGTPAPVESRERQARRAYAGAEAARRAGDLAGALRLVGLSVEMLAGGQWPFVETLARLRQSELLLERGDADDQDAARDELKTVVAFWRRAGATWFLSRLAVWAKARGLSVPPPKRQSSQVRGPLTPREREVAALVAAGSTSKEIAALLVISERTVESHVERIMDKLGVRTRAEIAAKVTATARA